jgi:SAM-dependent methyltransferase
VPDAEFTFHRSPVLGDRADGLYEWFRRSLDVPGDIAECGVFAGDTSRELVRYVEHAGIDKVLHMFDTFAGLPPIVTEHERAQPSGGTVRPGLFRCDRDTVVARMGTLRRYVLHEGLFSETFATFDLPLCFIHADADLYVSTLDVIRLADRCLSPGGRIVFDDYCNPEFRGVTRAVDEALDPRRYDVVRSPETLQCFATRRP